MKKNLLTGILCLFAVGLFGCSSNLDTGYRVHFDTCTDLETNVIPDQLHQEGDLINEPIIITPNNPSLKQKVSGWYTSTGYDTKWNFDTDTVKGNMTLYAKWSNIHCIYYYLQNTTEPIWTVSDHCVGETLELHDELCDGYHFDGYFQDSECTVPFDLTKPLTEDTSVYMKRDSQVELNPYSIKRRFVNVAAGGSGSKAGSIAEPATDSFGNEYVDVNFGYSTSADPYIQITNPVLNISKSQKLTFEFKNLGEASGFSLYWVSKYADDSYSGGTSYYTQNNCINVNLSDAERNMKKDENTWLKKEVDVAQITQDGVSTWGNSVSLIKLRIQFKYISKFEQDESNIIRFKSIIGTYDTTHVGFNDTAEIKAKCVNDDPSKISEAAGKQSALVRGLRFPLNNANIVDKDSDTYYKKTDGLLLYSKYGNNSNKFVFTPAETIKADDYSYIRIRLTNYSYISSITFSVLTLNGSKKSSSGGQVAIASEQTAFKDYYLNLFENTSFTGNVVSFSISFNFKGVNNAILLHEIEFEAARSYQVPGINLNSPNKGGFESDDPGLLSVARDPKNGGTKFVASAASSATAKPSYDLSTQLYSSMNVDFLYPVQSGQSMTTMKIKVVTDKGTETCEFKEVTPDYSFQTLSLPYDTTKGGKINSVTVNFNGACNIVLKSITFDPLEAESVDFSKSSVLSSMVSGWNECMTFDSSLTAGFMSSPTKTVRYYFGDRYAANVRKSGNISLAGKSRVYVIYQKSDFAAGDTFHVFLYGLKKSSTSEYSTAVGSTKIMDKYMELNELSTYDSWNIGYIDIDSQYTADVEDYYLVSQVTLTFAGAKFTSPSMAIRAVVIR